MPTATLNGAATTRTSDINMSPLSRQATAPAPHDTTPVATSDTKPLGKLRAKLAESRAIAQELVATSDSPRATFALNGGLAIAAVCNFILSAVGLIDFAQRVMHYDAPLSWLVPIAVDGFAICIIGALYRERNAPWRVRAYLWFAYAIPTACSVAGNVSHGTARNYSDTGVAVAGVFPILLSVAIHVWIGVNRRTERAKKRVNKKESPVATSATPRRDESVATQPDTTRHTTPVATVARQNKTATLIADAYTTDATATQIRDKLAAKGHDISVRTIQRHMSRLATTQTKPQPTKKGRK